MNNFKTTALACAIAPLAVLPVLMVSLVIMEDFQYVLMVTVPTLLVAYICVFVIGVPFHALASWLRFDSVVVYAVSGFIIAALIIPIIVLLEGDLSVFWRRDFQYIVLLFGFFGMSVAASFRIVVDWTGDFSK